MIRPFICAVAIAACSTPAFATPINPQNIALGGTATASAFWESNSFFAPARAIDGSTFDAFAGGNYWLLPNVTPGWWQVDLGAEFPIGFVRILNCNNGGANDRATKDFRLEILDAGQAVVYSSAGILPFTSLSSMINPTVPFDIDLASAVSGRFVRVYVDSWYPTRTDPTWPFFVIPSGDSNNEGGGLNDVQVFAAASDTTKPVLAPVASTDRLWPPNHQMVDVVIAANATDDSGSVQLSASISSNEPQEGLGDGDQPVDWSEPQIDQANGTVHLLLRAERSGSGTGRVYSVKLTATDPSGNAASATVDISVPHSRR